MASLKEIRNRISSVASTIQITSAMKMVSAAKLKKAQDAITQLRPYSEKMQELLINISSSLDADAGGEFTKQKPIKKVLFVTIASNRGLAGAFNSSIVKTTQAEIEANYKNCTVELLTISRKAFDVLKKSYSVYKNENSLWDNLTFENVTNISNDLIEKFKKGEYDKIILVYNRFKNAATQYVTVEQFLPIDLKNSETVAKKNSDYIFEPVKEDIVTEMIPKSLRIQLFKAVLDSNASEHGARMTAMHKATDNAESIKQNLIITYNKARQAAITNEIIEIVSGANALAG